MSARTVLTAGLTAAVAMFGVTCAFHLLNQPSDLAVAGGYVILLVMVAGAVEWMRRVRK